MAKLRNTALHKDDISMYTEVNYKNDILILRLNLQYNLQKW